MSRTPVPFDRNNHQPGQGINNETKDVELGVLPRPGVVIMSNIKLTYFCFIFLVLAARLSAQQGLIACPPKSSNYSPYWASSAVFTGTVERLERGEKQTIMTFAVAKAYRGVSVDHVQVATESNSGSGFVPGEKYFVYAYTQQDGRLFVPLCSPLKSLADAAEDIEYAEEVAAGKSGTRIYGYVYEDKQESPYEQPAWVPLPGRTVTIKDRKSRKLTARTDEKGRYMFKEVAEGAYEIKTETPVGMHRRQWPISLAQGDRVYISQSFQPGNLPGRGDHHWDSKDFAFTTQGSIRGRIGMVDGKTAPQQFVELIAFDKTGKLPLDDTYRYQWTNRDNGEFEFGPLAPGKYALAINPRGCHTRGYQVYDRTFFPGVSDSAAAQVIIVEKNQDIKLKDFKPPPPLKERWFSGIVLNPDGSPAADARVFLRQKNVSFTTCVNSTDNVQTDEAGRFRIKGYETYEYIIRALTESGSGLSMMRALSPETEISASHQADNIRLIIQSPN